MRIGKLDYSWVVLISCALLMAIGMGISFSFGVFFKSLEADFNLSRASTSAILSLFLILSPAFAIVVNWLRDRYGPALAFALIGVFMGFSLLMTSRVNDLWHLFITYSVLLAIGIGPIFAVALSTTARWFVKRRGMALGIISASGGIGIIIMSPLSAYLIAHFGWQTSYLILGLVAFVGITPLALVHLKSSGKSLADRVSEGLPANRDSTGEKPSYLVGGGTSAFRVLLTPNFWLMFCIELMGSTCIYIVMTHLVPHATDLGIEPTRAAFLLSFINGVNAVGRVFFGRLSDSVGRKKVIIGSTIVMAGSVLSLIWVNDFWSLCLFAVVFGFTYGGYAAPYHALMADTFGGRNLGMIMAMIDAGWGLGGAIGSALAGYVFDITGNYSYAFLIGAVCILMVGAFAAAVRQKQRQK